ncbi:MAG: MerR family transcriptional regulator, partial [Candidatus Altiarchaeales archaeon]|nr:MerR family transcriptional regulator [Candidatus Altiarchaeales archaeon]
MEQKLLGISKTAEILGVHPNTLREWDREGKLKSVKTCGNHRRYKLSDIEKMCEETHKKKDSDEIRVAVYRRVSSHD